MVSVTVTLSEATTVTGTPQLALNIGGSTVQAGYASGSGSTALVFTYTILAGQTDTDGISIAADSLSLNSGTLKDAAGNNATLTHTLVADNSGYLVDTTAPTAPTIAIVATDDIISAAEQAATVTVTGSNETGMTTTLNGAAVTQATATTWSYVLSAAAITAFGQGAETLTAVSTDAAGNTTTTSRAITVDTVAPIVSSIAITSSSGIQNSTLNAGDVVSVTVTLSEATTVTGTPQLALNIGGSTVQANYASGSGSTALVFTYTILATQTDADGISIAADSLSLNGGTLKDAAGNNATLSHALVADNAGYKVDTTAPTAPTINAVATDDIINAAEQTATVTVTGSNETGMATTLNGAAVTQATATTWSYVLSAAPITAFGQGAETLTAVSTDAAGNTTTTTRAITVDTVAPTVSSVAITSATGIQNSTLNAGDVVSITVTLSEATTVTGTPQLALNIGGSTVQASYASGSGSTALVFTYTILAGQTDTDGISIAADSLSLNGGTLKDAAGNDATLTHAAVNANPSFIVDTTTPTLDLDAASDTGSSNTDNITNDTTPTFAVTGTSGASITLFNDTNSNGTVDTGESLGTTTLSGTTSGSITSSVLAANRYTNIKVIGNTGNASAAHAAITVDTTAAAPTLDLTATSDTINSTDNITYDTTPTFAVTGESGATITLFNDTNSNGTVDSGESLGTTTLSGTTNGSITSSALAASAGGTAYTTIKVKQTDAAGNISAASSAHTTITIKDGVTVPTLDLADASDTGSNNTDNITSDDTPTFAVTGAAGTTLTLFNDIDGNGVVAASGESLGSVALGAGVTSGTITASTLTPGTYDRIKVISSESANAVSGTHAPIVISTATPTVTNTVTENFNDGNWDNWVRPTAYGTESMAGTTLQLTSAGNDQAGGALYNTAFASSQAMTFEFRYYSGDGTGADGISFFLVDGANTAFNLGGNGDRLGYADRPGNNGLDGGWLGIGLLEYTGGGIFTNNAGANTQGIGLLGSESASTPYGYITSTLESGMGSHSIDGGYRRIKITLGSSTTNTLQVQWDWNDDDTYDYTPVNVDLDSYSSLVAARPDTLKFGFAAGTGGSNNVHSLDWVKVTTGSAVAAITSATGAQNNTLNAGDVVSVTVSLSEPATVTGTPQLALNIGGTTVQANYASGSGSNALLFTYTIQAGQSDSNGISIDVNALALNGGTIQSASGTSATITHLAVADDSSYKVDTTAPTLASSSPVDGAVGVALSSNIVLTFSENVAAGTGNIVISNGAGDTRTIAVGDAQVSISGNIATINPTGDLLNGSAYNVQMLSGVLLDAAGNPYSGITDATTWNFST